jgi:hypothetical protein
MRSGDRQACAGRGGRPPRGTPTATVERLAAELPRKRRQPLGRRRKPRPEPPSSGLGPRPAHDLTEGHPGRPSRRYAIPRRDCLAEPPSKANGGKWRTCHLLGSDRPLPFEQLEPYMRGAKFAAVALSGRHKEHDPDLADDAARYVEMTERYRQAAIATFRAKRERSQS